MISRRFNIILKTVSWIVVFFFSWFCIEPWNYAMAANNGHSQPPKISKKKASAPQRIQDTLRRLKKLSAKLEKQMEREERGRDAPLPQLFAAEEEAPLELDEVELYDQELGDGHASVLAYFSQVEQRLREKGLPAEVLEKHQEVVGTYQVEFQALRKKLKGVKDLRREIREARRQGDRELAKSKRGQLRSQIKQLKAYLYEKVEEPPHQELDPNNLPNRRAKPNTRKPRRKKEEFTELRKPIQLAFNGDPSTLVIAQSASATPIPEDLAETPEVKFTPEILELAEQLEHNPVKIYEYVRNNFKFEPTYGSIKGSQETLLAKSGNAIDTATVLIALLRASGIPARYVVGTVAIPIDKVLNWLGVETPEVAHRVLSTGGIPAVQLTEDGVVTHMELEHAWVSVFADYVPSLGAFHEEGDTWVEMDASFKQFERMPQFDQNQAFPFDTQTFINEVVSTGTIDEEKGFVTGLDQGLIEQTISEYRLTIQNYLDSNLPGATFNDLVDTEDIVDQSIGVMAPSLPFRVLVRGEITAQIPEVLRHRVRFTVAGLNYTESIANLGRKRITVSFTPSNEIDRFLIGENSEVLPAFLIHVTPVLKLDGEEVARGVSVQLGEVRTLVLEFSEPSAPTSISRFQLTTGGYYAIGFNANFNYFGQLEDIKASVKELNNILAGQPDTLVSVDETIGRLLQTAVLNFWIQLGAHQSLVLKKVGAISVRPTAGAGPASINLAVDRVFGLPVSAKTEGYVTLNIQRNIISFVPRSENRDLGQGLFMLYGFLSSQLEGIALQDLLGVAGEPTISTTAILATAIQQNLRVFRIDLNNIDKVFGDLQINETIRQDIRNAVNAGKQVVIPEKEVTIGEWTGTGYIIQGKEEQAFLISRGFAGATQEQKDAIKAGLSTLLEEFLNNEIATLFEFFLDSLSPFSDPNLSEDEKLAAYLAALVNLAVGLLITVPLSPPIVDVVTMYIYSIVIVWANSNTQLCAPREFGCTA